MLENKSKIFFIDHAIWCFIFLLMSNTIAHAEVLHYSIQQLGIKAGNATLEFVGPAIYNNTDTLLVKFKADGLNFLDQENIYLDKQSYRPLFVERRINIFGNKEEIVETYTPGQIKIVKTVSGKTTTQVIEKQGDIENIYGYIWRMRLEGQFDVGKSVDIKLPTTDIAMKVVKLLSLNAAGKKFEAAYIQSEPSKYKIWFEAGGTHVPLRIAGAVGFGNTVMILSKIE